MTDQTLWNELVDSEKKILSLKSRVRDLESCLKEAVMDHRDQYGEPGVYWYQWATALLDMYTPDAATDASP